jgi:putative acetyltransferase
VEAFSIRPEQPADHALIDQLHRDAFGDDKVPTLVRALRQATGPVPISLVAFIPSGALAGHVMLSAGLLDAPDRLVEVMTLSPLAVAEPFRRQGIGGALVRAGLAAAEERGTPLVFLEGNPRNYERLGFRPAGPLGFRRPSLRIPEAAFQVFPLRGYEPSMTGTFVYSAVFWANDCVGLR